MASELSNPDPNPAAERPLRLGLSRLNRSIGRRAPSREIVRVQRAGELATTISSFGRALGGSLRARPARAAFPFGMPDVRFPAGVWSMPKEDAPLPSNIDPAMAVLQARLRQNKPKKTVSPPPRRGLPSTLRRHGMSHTGPGTGPSAMVNRLQPADTYIPRNDGHGAASSGSPQRLKPASNAAAASSSPPPSTGWTSTPSRPRPSASAEHSAKTPRVNPGRPSSSDSHRTSGRAAQASFESAGSVLVARRSSVQTSSEPFGVTAYEPRSLGTLRSSRNQAVLRSNAIAPIGFAPGAVWAAAPATRALLAHSVKRTETISAGVSAQPIRTSRSTPRRPKRVAVHRRTVESARPERAPWDMATRAVTRPSAGHLARQVSRRPLGSRPTFAGRTAAPRSLADMCQPRHMMRLQRSLPTRSTLPSESSTSPAASSETSWAARLEAAFSVSRPTSKTADQTVRAPFGIPLGAERAATPSPFSPVASVPGARTNATNASAGRPASARRDRSAAGPQRRFARRISRNALDSRPVVDRAVVDRAVVDRAARNGSHPRPVVAAVPFGQTFAAPLVQRIASSHPRQLKGVQRRVSALTAESGISRLERALPGTKTAALTPASIKATGPAPTGSGAPAATAWAARLEAAFGAPVIDSTSVAHHQSSLAAQPSSAARSTPPGEAPAHPSSSGSGVVARSVRAAREHTPPAGRTFGTRWTKTAASALASTDHPVRSFRSSDLHRSVTQPIDAVASAFPTFEPNVGTSRRFGRTPQNVSGTPTRLHPFGGETSPVVLRETSAARPNQSHAHAQHRPVHERREAAMSVLRRSPSLRTRALPASYRSLAASMTNASITIAHDATARAVLAAAGTQAATIGRTILMDRAPSTGARDREVVAHEMVHAMANTAVPRFFDDPHHDHEERAAVSVGRLARGLRSELVATEPIQRMVMSAMPATAQRSLGTMTSDQTFVPTPRAASSNAVGGATSATSAASATSGASTPRRAIHRSAGGRSTTTIHRSSSGAASSSAAAPARPSIRREVAAAPSGTPAQQPKGAVPDVKADASVSVTDRLDQIEELAALIEARVLAELERRGGQHRGWI